MLNNKTFYHGITQKIIVAFGNLFNNISVVKYDDTGRIIAANKVPLVYGQKERWYDEMQSIEEDRVHIELPMMSFYITSLSYDSSRKISTVQKMVRPNPNSDETMLFAFNSVPYEIGIELATYTRKKADDLMIIEQILPYFAPTFNIMVDIVPEIELTKDIPITLVGITPSDDFESGEEAKKRMISTTMDFIIKADYLGPVQEGKIIKNFVYNYYTNVNSIAETAPASSNTITNAEERTIIVVDPANANVISWITDLDFAFTVNNITRISVQS